MSASGGYNQSKRARARRELEFFQAEFAEWLKARRDDDPLEQHASQFAAIEACITGAARGLSAHLDALDLSVSRGAFAEKCRLHELRLLWLRRLWKFFRDRLDQRKDDRLRHLLRAADEIAWSAWRPVAQYAENEGLDLSLSSNPLPFVELEYSPAAIPVSWVPRELCRDAGPELPRYLERLPISLVRLPVACVSSPWWLVFIGHEVGHHVQHAFALAGDFEKHLRQAVRQSAVQQQLGDADTAAERWGRWSQEVFADVYSVVSFGRAAVRAMAEFEQHLESRMAEAGDRYPPAAVRLELMARLVEQLGLLDARESLAGLDPKTLVEGHVEAEEDLQLLDAVVAASRKVLPGLDTLEGLLGFNVSQFQLRWPEVPQPFELSGPRRMASAALLEWSRIEASALPNAEAKLAADMPRLIGKDRLPGRRSGEDPDSQGVDGRELSKLLLDLAPPALEAVARGAE